MLDQADALQPPPPPQQEEEGSNKSPAAQKPIALSVGGAKSSGNNHVSAPSLFREKKLHQVLALLERETALVEAVGGRLARLSS